MKPRRAPRPRPRPRARDRVLAARLREARATGRWYLVDQVLDQLDPLPPSTPFYLVEVSW